MSLILLFLPTSASSVVVPTVVTGAVSNINPNYALGSGKVTNNGGASVTEFGLVFSTNANPTTNDTKIVASGNSVAFSAYLSLLLSNVTYHVRAYAINSAGTGYGADVSFTTSTLAQLQKRFYLKIYDQNLKYVTTWSKDVLSDPNFRQVINGGLGELVVRLGRKYDNFGENVDVALNNRVELWIGDNDNLANNAQDFTLWDNAKWDVDQWDGTIKSFVKIFGGTISAYAPIVDNADEYVDVTVLGYVTEASYRLLKDGSGNTTFTYTAQDPGTIIKDMIDKYRADGGVNINYVGNSVQMTGTTVTYKFQHVTLKNALDKLIDLSPDNWYYYIDQNGTVFFQQAEINKADHTLTVGKDVLYSQTTKRTENVVNEVSVVGGGNPNLLNIYTRTGSVNTNGKHHRVVQDGQVIDNPTADAIAKRLLNMYQTPETRSIIRILDNNGEDGNQGANIENFRVGDTIQLKNINFGVNGTTLWDSAVWDTDVWDFTIQYTTASVLTIVSLSYTPDYIEIEASSRLPEVSKELQTLNKLITQQAQQNLPVAPVVRVI